MQNLQMDQLRIKMHYELEEIYKNTFENDEIEDRKRISDKLIAELMLRTRSL